jgi:hypothetical protein
MQTSIGLINVFFYFVASIGITLCFFILLVSFDASVRQVCHRLLTPTSNIPNAFFALCPALARRL